MDCSYTSSARHAPGRKFRKKEMTIGKVFAYTVGIVFELESDEMKPATKESRDEMLWTGNEWMNDWMNESRKEGMKEWRNEGRKEGMKEGMTEWMIAWMKNSMKGMNSWMNKWMNEWMKEWRKERTNEQRNELNERTWPTSSSKSAPAPLFLYNILKWKSSSRSALATVSRAHLADLIFQKCSDPLIFFAILECKAISLKCKSSSRCSLVRILPTSSSQNAPIPSVVLLYDFEMQIELPLQSGAHFADLIFQKCSSVVSFLTFWSANRALATILCTFCLQFSQIEPCYPKGHRVAGTIVFSPVNSHVPELLHFPTT